MSSTMTIHLEPDVKERRDRIAAATSRSKSFLAAEAIHAFIELDEWQIHEIQAALKEADNGDFATEKEVKNIREKWL